MIASPPVVLIPAHCRNYQSTQARTWDRTTVLGYIDVPQGRVLFVGDQGVEEPRCALIRQEITLEVKGLKRCAVCQPLVHAVAAMQDRKEIMRVPKVNMDEYPRVSTRLQLARDSEERDTF